MIQPRLGPRLRLRHKVLSLDHRFPKRRFFTIGISLIILAAVPLAGLARFDLYAGQHRVLFEDTGATKALAAVLVGFGGLVAVTFAFNLIGGRLFCGWGCPIGQISRFGEALETANTRGSRRLRSALEGGAFSAALSLSLMLWWTHPAAFISSSPSTLFISYGVLALLIAGSFLHGRVWRWGFCRKACPIGLYYSVVSPSASYGIVFEPHLGTCIDCDACSRVCPVHLHPRELIEEISDIGGLALSGLPSDNHCLRCGDCVSACELMLKDRSHDEIPLHFGLGIKGRPIRPRKDTNVET